jgi:hypothetical protein
MQQQTPATQTQPQAQPIPVSQPILQPTPAFQQSPEKLQNQNVQGNLQQPVQPAIQPVGQPALLPKPDGTASQANPPPMSTLDLLAGLDIHAPPVSLISTPKQIVLSEPHFSESVPNATPDHGIAALKSEVAAVGVLKASGQEEVKRASAKKSLGEKDVERLRNEAEKLEHLVGGLTSRSLQGTVPLDTKWRDLLKLAEQTGTGTRY